MRNLLTAVAVTAALFALWNVFCSYQTVTEVLDGDTFKVGSQSVRLIGVNAPELGQQCSYEAKEKLEEMLMGNQVRMESDFGDKDVYGRLLRYVYVDGTFVNAEMVRLGLAKAEDVAPNDRYSDEFFQEEAKARKAGRCMWE